MSDRPVPDLAQMQAFLPNQPFSAWSGIEIVSAAEGEVALELAMRPEFRQHHGFLHGGMIAFLADSAISWAAASAVGDCVTSQLDVRMLSPARGERFRAVGKVVKASRRIVTVRADILSIEDGQEKLAAIATGTVTPV